MKCAECGQLLPMGSRFCTACGHRIALALVDEEPAIVKKPPPLDPRMRDEPALMRKPLSLESRPATQRDAASSPGAATHKTREAPALWMKPWLRHLPTAMVAGGVALAFGILFSAQHDRAMAEKAGANRIAAATGPLGTSQPASPRLDFSPRHALQGLFGNYDPHLDGAFWTVTGAPMDRAEWNGKAVLVKPLVSRTDETGTRHVLVTSTADVNNGIVVKQGTACRTCQSLVGVALYERRGAEWQLVSHRPFANVGGAFGAPPQVAVMVPAKGGVELDIQPPVTQVASAPEQGSIAMNDRARVVKVRTPQRSTDRRTALRDDSPFPSSVPGP